MRRPAFLMSRPTFYGIAYEINPWMSLHRQADRPRAIAQWQTLRRALIALGARVHLCRAQPGLPDMTFTANAGLIYRRTFIPSRFRYKERAGEEPHFQRWFKAHGFHVVPLPEGGRFEGAGDALFLGNTLFAGYYFRSDFITHAQIERLLNVRALSLELVNDYFYHLDTCFCPISADAAIYYPGAFSRYSRKVLRENVPELIPVARDEADQFGCNAVIVGRHAIIAKPCRKLGRSLTRRGYKVHPLEMSEFIKAGGAARCLTLRLA